MIGALYADSAASSFTNDRAMMKISVPVRPLLLSNFMFKHVRTVPARNEEETTPSYKIQLLEDFIDRIMIPASSTGREHAHADLQERIAAAGFRLQTVVRSWKEFSAGILPPVGTFVDRLV